ncbi:MAG TPA: hypothetical protein VGR61_00670 [Candidatus Dormibacteraeota bacterium]|nr:hypothetical protein [Candidatus Dormibacteraeota bacterium]
MASAGLLDALAVARLLRDPGGRPRRLAATPAVALAVRLRAVALVLAGVRFLAVVALLARRPVALARRVVARPVVPLLLARRPALARLRVVARLGAGGVLPSDALG